MTRPILSAGLAMSLAVPAMATDAVPDRDGPYFHVIDDALEQMADTGRFDWKERTGLIALVACEVPQ